MSYASILASVFGKRPVWLVRMSLGTEIVYLTTLKGGFTTGAGKPDSTFAGSQDWTASSLNIGSIKLTTNIDDAETEISLPASDSFARLFLGEIGILTGAITIWHGFQNDVDGEFVPKFRARVVEVRPALDVITLVCESVLTISRRKALSTVVQRPCRHVVYRGGCGAVLADQQVSATASAVTGLEFTVAEAAAQADGHYAGGLITFDGVEQMIRSHLGDKLVLLGVLPGLAEAIAGSGPQAVLIARGCRRIQEDCIALDAFLDFGGFPNMTDSPFDGRSIA